MLPDICRGHGLVHCSTGDNFMCTIMVNNILLIQFCWSRGGYLAEIKTKEEEEVLDQILPQGITYWIGLEDFADDGTFFCFITLFNLLIHVQVSMFGLSPTTLPPTLTGQKDSPPELMERIAHGRQFQDKMRRAPLVGMMLGAQKLFTMVKFMLCVRD